MAAEEKKASEIVILDVARKSGVTDNFLICSAESERQVIAVKDQIEKALDDKGTRLYGLEGLEAGVWVLMDYDDVVVHIVLETKSDGLKGCSRLVGDLAHAFLLRNVVAQLH